MSFPARLRWLPFLLLACLPATAAPPTEHSVHEGHALGRVSFPVSCSATARADFEQALALLHHMTYPQARAAFESLSRREPDCAMAHWGIAMTLFQPLWPTRPSPADLARGSEAIRATRELPQSGRERALIDAAAAFFDAGGTPDYWARIRRWEAAMQQAHARFPEDPEITAFRALALLAVSPPDARARANADRAAALLLPVYRHNPDHPGAMHYLVHANDVPGREHELAEVVRRYEGIAPDNPHALHMPTHIYTRQGDWPAVVRGNLRAAEAALAHPAGDRGQYVWDEFPHAIEYLVYALLQQGQDRAAETQLQRLKSQARLEPTFKTAFHLSSIPARMALERRDWKAAADLPPRTPADLAWDRFPWPEAITWFARGMGSARTGRLDDTEAAVDRLRQLETRAAGTGEALFERHIRVLRLATSGWLAQARGEPERARTLLSEAADLEAATPKHAVTPAPTLPAGELLGDLLLEQQRPAEALAAYERALALYPRRFNGMLGAARAAKAARQLEKANAHYAALLALAPDGDRAEVLREARAGADGEH